MFTYKRTFMILAAVLVGIAFTHSAQARGGGHPAMRAHAARAGGNRGAHPRYHETMRRDRNISSRANRDYGHLGGHYGQISREDRGIRHEVRHDMRQNGGYLTKGEQNKINGQENRVNNQIANDYRGRGNWNSGGGPNRGWNNRGWQQRQQFDRNHPRRAEVVGRDNNLGRDINMDKGKLGGNYQNLMSQDKSIHQQERADARADGGHITKAEKQQLNQEENGLKNQVKQDYR